MSFDALGLAPELLRALTAAGYDTPTPIQVKAIPELVGTLGSYLIGAHAAAALFHHYVKRDNTLVRMLPSKVCSEPSNPRV